MTISKDKILQAEILLKINLTQKRLRKMLHESYPTNGPASILKFSRGILDLIISRYNRYSINQLLFIKTKGGILDFILMLIWQIEHTTIKNVTWSIIPAYDRLFKSLFPGAEYIITPQWEQNYQIFSYNLIDRFKKYIEMPNLIFEANDEFQSKINNFLSIYPPKVYLVMYSRLEKLSGIHMALLGHEIGHIYAEEWIVNDYPEAAKKAGLFDRLKKIVEEEIRRTDLENDLFKSLSVKEKLEKYDDLIKRNYRELISDLFGCAIFGHTYVVSAYLYFLLSQDMEVNNWEKGYLPWKYRLQNCQNFLVYIQNKETKKLESELSLYDQITAVIKGPIQNKKHDVCILLLDIFSTISEDIYKSIFDYTKDEFFLAKVNDIEIDAALQRLKSDIIPNAINKNGIDYPINIRNILYAIWLLCYNDKNEDIHDYSDQIQFYNLLGIKGIELSVEQENYNDYIKRSDN